MLASGSSKAFTLFRDKKVATRPSSRPSLILESHHSFLSEDGIWGFGFTDPDEFLVSLCITCDVHQILKCKVTINVCDPVLKKASQGGNCAVEAWYATKCALS